MVENFTSPHEHHSVDFLVMTSWTIQFFHSPDNARAHLGGKYGNATTNYLLDEVQCIGTEDTIGDCPKNPWGINNCDITEAAGVSCIQEDPGLPGRESFKLGLYSELYFYVYILMRIFTKAFSHIFCCIVYV